MKRITLIALAVAGLSFTAAPSYAQSSYGGNSNDSYGNSSVDRDAARAARKAKKAAKKAEKERLKAEAMKADTMMAKEDVMMVKDQSSATGATMIKDQSSATDTAMMKEGDFMMAKEEKALMVKSETFLPTNCPAGTEPQTDGTCMLK